MAKRLEENYVKKLGDTNLYSYWKGRTFMVFTLMIMTPEDRPPYAELAIHTINIRSNAQRFYNIGLISTHAMERLLERRNDVNLLALLKEELDFSFLNSFLEVLDNRYENGGFKDKEFKLNTATGVMCIRIPDGDIVPVFTTWYPQ